MAFDYEQVRTPAGQAAGCSGDNWHVLVLIGALPWLGRCLQRDLSKGALPPPPASCA